MDITIPIDLLYRHPQVSFALRHFRAVEAANPSPPELQQALSALQLAVSNVERLLDADFLLLTQIRQRTTALGSEEQQEARRTRAA